jgi:mono/diheme cytochrome c family protein
MRSQTAFLPILSRLTRGLLTRHFLALNPLVLSLLVLNFLVGPAIARVDQRGTWQAKVPAKDRDRGNPLPDDSQVIDAGAKIFARNCASCHGKDACGSGRRPSLRTPRVQTATDGELQWLLRNGSIAQGMPSWSRLPEVQRWQLVRYLHSLPPADPDQSR